jgi:hypothetical protein
MHGHRDGQSQVQLIAAVVWNDIPSRRPLIGRIEAHTDALANRLSTAVSRKVDKRWEKFWVAYGTLKRVIGYDLLLWR